MQEEEIWKDISGYENAHQVSNFGNFRSLDRVFVKRDGDVAHYKGISLKVHFRIGDDYGQIGIRAAGIQTTHYAHILIAKHFVPNPNNLPEVNHIDGNKRNLHYSNFEWTDKSGNEKHAHRIGIKNFKGQGSISRKYDESDIREIRRRFDEKEATRKELAAAYKIPYRTIASIISKQCWKHI